MTAELSLDRTQLRSYAWGQHRDQAGMTRRAFLKAEGYTDEDLSKPIIGICNTWSELNPCNIHLRQVAEAVKRGVWQAGGFPLEFNTLSLNEVFWAPTTMLYRNLLAIETEEALRAQPLDAVVLLASCDKTVPAQLMAAASANIPAIMVTGGPLLSGRYRGEDIGVSTDLYRYWNEYRAGNITEEDLAELENSMCPSCGHCTIMGTASTMASMAEALGMMLPGGAAIPAVDARRYQFAEASGRQIMRLLEQDIRPSDILTPEAFDNAIRICMAIGGSTNVVIHLIAIARRLGIDLTLDRFDRLSRETPYLCAIKPSGPYMMEHLFEAGGIPAVMAELRPLLHLDALTVTGKTVGENLARARVLDRRVIAPLDQPLRPEGGIAVLHGSLAPTGAVIKQSAASPHLLRHRGPALVFNSAEEIQRRIVQERLEASEDTVLVMRYQGPLGAPGMPETGGSMPIPENLLKRGIRDVLRITDARMSGTAYGTIVLHVEPEAAAGGPLAVVQDGDEIEIDVLARRLDLLVDEREIQRRLAQWRPPERPWNRGYRALFLDHVLQASQGCDFDFLAKVDPETYRPPRRPV